MPSSPSMSCRAVRPPRRGVAVKMAPESRSLLVLESFVLCRHCSNDPNVHRRLFFACPERHAPIDHASGAAVFVSRGRAAQAVSIQPARPAE
jgi:hypothetical protein